MPRGPGAFARGARGWPAGPLGRRPPARRRSPSDVRSKAQERRRGVTHSVANVAKGVEQDRAKRALRPRKRAPIDNLDLRMNGQPIEDLGQREHGLLPAIVHEHDGAPASHPCQARGDVMNDIFDLASRPPLLWIDIPANLAVSSLGDDTFELLAMLAVRR